MFSEGAAPVLVLGVGNVLVGDEGVGIHLLHRLSRWRREWNGAVELLEGGTQSTSRLGPLACRAALVLLDAVSLGAVPGTVYMRRDEDALDLRYRASSSHTGDAGELLAKASLEGDLPERIFLVGIEPSRRARGGALSEPVLRAIPAAVEAARHAVTEALASQDRSQPLQESDDELWAAATGPASEN